MRFSDSKPLVVAEPLAGTKEKTNRAFLAGVHAKMPKACAGALLLAGGNDPCSMALRNAQRHLRLDRRPSYWSHAALVLEWNRDDPEQSWGVEVTLAPQEPERHRPEHNGVTRFRVAQYLASSWVNLAIAPIEVSGAEKKTALDGVREAALAPHRRGTRYPLWDWIGAWLRYVYAGDAVPNPLREGVPMPSAGLVEMILDAGNVAAAPGATEMNLCPELLWGTIKHWHDRISTEDTVKIARAWQIVRDKTGTAAEAVPGDIEPLPSGTTPRRKSRA